MTARGRAMAAMVAACAGWQGTWLAGLMYARWQNGGLWWAGVAGFAAGGVLVVGAVLAVLPYRRDHTHEWRAVATFSGVGMMAGMGTGPSVLGSTVVVWRCPGCTGPASVTTSTVPGRFRLPVFTQAGDEDAPADVSA